MTIRIAGIQPGYLPWLGHFDQMMRVDAFVIADELPFSSAGWTHRNRVKGPDGQQWLTLPARPHTGLQIRHVPLDLAIPWKRKHMATLRHLYSKAEFAHPLLDDLEEALPDAAAWLPEASIPTIRLMAERLRVETPLLISSELGLEARYAERFPDLPGPTQRIMAYMEALGATELVQGESGRDYFDVELFASAGFRVYFQHYAHPVYRQLHGPFVSHLSTLDLMLCEGEEQARRVLLDALRRTELT